MDSVRVPSGILPYQDVTPNDTRLEKCRDYGLIYYYRSSEKVKEEKEISC